MSKEQNIPKEQLYKTVRGMLDEIGYNRQLPVIRWLGILLLKVLKKTCNGLYVNEESVHRVSFFIVVFILMYRAYRVCPVCFKSN